MRVAPPVDHPVARRGLWSGAAAAVAALAVCAPVLWATDHVRSLQSSVETTVWSVALLGLVVAAAAAGATWRRLAQATEQRLRWDGTGWQLRMSSEVIELNAPVRRMDLGHAALLSARTATGREIWLPVERQDDPRSWHGLQVALRQPPPAADRAARLPGEAAA